ncbi:hypothetical protein SB49_14155 [Sediminicola sp. YIK13]|uniref:hypothetical protein n=1 Tax=Sediminicola sp. YIK13 TaxID=1453352 RepID=UPI00072143B7|nr:hypothetical protein [Sediminicola sp. YIK13]ALM08810.1 hypothetical protein SB49_14155 [Sediminicola sp. YIK13]
MALLKKIKASTLMETMVATVLIVVIFMIASMLLNSLFRSSIIGNTQALQERMVALEYQYKNGLIAVPHYEEWNTWEINIRKGDEEEFGYIVFKAIENETQKERINYLINNE